MFVILAGIFVSAQTSSDLGTGLPYGLNVNQLEAANNKIINISSNVGYLGQQWKKIILENPVTNWINGALTTISPFFKVVMAQDYSFSISFLITFVLWLFFFLSFNKIFKDYTSFSPLIALGVAFLVTVAMAQLTVIGRISNFIVWVIFGVGKSWWVQILLGIGCGLALAMIFLFIASFGKVLAKKRQEKKEFKERLDIETGAKSGEALTKAMSSLEKRK